MLCVGCSLSSVIVEKSPATVERLLKQATFSNPKVQNNFDSTARTTWYFACKPSFDYDVVSESTSGGQTTAILLIRRVQMQISLPIQVRAAKNAPPDLLAHENGHVRICHIIYTDADRLARESAQKVIGRQFTGVGIDSEAARQKALDAAGEQICSAYRQGTVERVNDISDLYDQISTAMPSLPVEAAVQESLKRSGATKRLR
jgi:hypothetical protein